jgi:hypothetical protein
MARHDAIENPPALPADDDDAAATQPPAATLPEPHATPKKLQKTVARVSRPQCPLRKGVNTF